MAKVTINDSGLEAKLGRLPLAARGPALVKAQRKAIKPFTKALRSVIDKGGPRQGQKADKKHLKNTITDKTVEYSYGALTLSGARWPEGAHFHLVDQGFKHYLSGAQVPGKDLVINAYNKVKGEVEKVMDEELAKILKEA